MQLRVFVTAKFSGDACQPPPPPRPISTAPTALVLNVICVQIC